MSQAPASPGIPVFLGIEGGGTRTTVRLEDARGAVLAELARGPAVLPLMSDRELAWHLRGIGEALPQAPQAVCLGLAGVRSETERERLRRAACRVWPGALCLAVNDLETALAAAPARGRTRAEVLVLSGTGSCCYGRTAEGRTAKVGGRGHVIGDRGSACDIGLRALRAVMADLDHHGSMGPLGAGILNALVFNEPDDLIAWSAQAPKTEIAALAVTVFAFAGRGDALARRLLAEAAAMLAEDACACAEQLAQGPEEKVRFIFNGGVLLKNPAFLKDVCRRIRLARPAAVMAPLKAPSVAGAVALARGLWQARGAAFNPGGAAILPARTGETPVPHTVPHTVPHAVPHVKAAAGGGLALPEAVAGVALLAESPTERRNPRSLRLDRLSAERGIELMLAEDAGIPPALRAERRAIAQVVEAVARAFQEGGHLFYAGAGTSGRLGVLDASEIPPTFRAPREQVQGIIAGGRQALWSAVEGAEDDTQAGAAAVAHRSLGAGDVLVGIAASGRTPFVWGALHEANERGAFTALLCCNPAVKKAAKKLAGTPWQPRVVIAPDVGPEVLTGSTRLKAGTATKMVLNMITTLAMTKAGKVISNLMVDLNPSNVKLRDRAERILVELTGRPREEARAALHACGWVVKEAHERLKSPEA